MRILLWATHLQTDLLALAYHLDAAPGVELLIVAPEPGRFLGEPIAQARPLRAPVLDRGDRGTLGRARAFGARVVVADNHLPPPGLAPCLAYLWHGLGWKARSSEDVRILVDQVKAITGLDPRRSNPRFLAQCYGEPDRRWRVERWGLHPESCLVLGMCFTDLLLDPPYTREALAPRYEIDVAGRPVVLLSLTWHFGGVFARRPDQGPRALWTRARGGLTEIAGVLPFGWGEGIARRLGPPPGWAEDHAFLDRMLGTARDAGAQVLLCLHERRRYAPAYLDAVARLAARHGHVQIKHKDEHPDNLADLLVSDVMVTNLSSFITYFYPTGRPVVHVHPVPDAGREVLRASLAWGRVRLRRAIEAEPLFMNDPEDNGGLLVRDVEGAAAALARGLAEPDCCRAVTASWLRRHVHGIDGHTGVRILSALTALGEAA